MIQIKKGLNYLDTSPEAVIERERLSPFFAKDEIPGEVSFPFTLATSQTNLKELGYIDQVAVKKDLQHDVILYDDLLQVTNGKLATEFVETDLIRSTGTISAFTLSNASEFCQRIKNKKLSDLTLGGERRFTWGNFSTTNAGFWKHIHDMTDTTTIANPEYTFYPIRNSGFTGDSAGWMNMLGTYNNKIEFARDANINTLCPAIFLVYLLKQIFTEHGYTLTGSFLNDLDFQALTIPSFYGIYWADGEPYITPDVTVGYHAKPLSSITMNLQQHVPPNYPISTFLVELQKLLPLGFDIDDNRRTCELILLSDIKPAGAKDISNQISSRVKMCLEKEQKIYALKREFDSNDSYPTAPDFKKDDVVGEVGNIFSFPSVFKPGAIVYVKDLDQYYRLSPTDDSNSPYVWAHYADNIFDYEPAGNNETLSCKMTPMPLSKEQMQPGLDGYFPICMQEGNWKFKTGERTDWQVRVLFYRGTMKYKNTLNYLPFAYPHNFHVNGALPTIFKIGNWSLSFIANGYGIYEVFFKKWFMTFANKETLLTEWRIPLSDYLSFRWKTPMLIDSTPYMVEKINEKLPYYRPGDSKSGSVDIQLRRMN